MTLYSPLWEQNDSYSADLDRVLIDLMFPYGGVFASGDLLVSQRAAGINRSVDVSTGRSAIPGTDVTAQGKYICWSDAVTNVPLDAAPGTGESRYDLIVAQVRDSDAIGGADNDWIITVVKGTAASTGSQTVPATPASAIDLAVILVGPNVTTIANAVITDARQCLSTGGMGWSTGDYKNASTAAAQAGWLNCDGSAVSRTTYSNLFALFSFTGMTSTYGTGDGTTTFNLPDHRGRTAVGSGSVGTNDQPTVTVGGTTANGVAGEAAHVLSVGELPSHTHNVSASGGGGTDGQSATHVHHFPSTNILTQSGGAGTQNLASGSIHVDGITGLTTGANDGDHNHAFTVSVAGTTDGGNGGGGAHNNMVPMLGVYVLIKT